MGEPNWNDIMKYDGSVPEPPYDTCQDCAAYEERLAALEAELARVKAESLRVVADGPVVRYLKCETVTMLLDGDLVAHDENGHCAYLLKTEDIAHISANRKVQPVRLERWEATDDNH